MKIEKEKYDKGFNFLTSIWKITDKDLPCDVWLEVVASYPHWSKKVLNYDIISYSCLPVKMDLVKEAL